MQSDITDCLIRGNDIQFERTNCLIRGNDLIIRENVFSIPQFDISIYLCGFFFENPNIPSWLSYVAANTFVSLFRIDETLTLRDKCIDLYADPVPKQPNSIICLVLVNGSGINAYQ